MAGWKKPSSLSTAHTSHVLGEASECPPYPPHSVGSKVGSAKPRSLGVGLAFVRSRDPKALGSFTSPSHGRPGPAGAGRIVSHSPTLGGSPLPQEDFPEIEFPWQPEMEPSTVARHQAMYAKLEAMR